MPGAVPLLDLPVEGYRPSNSIEQVFGWEFSIPPLIVQQHGREVLKTAYRAT